MVTRAEFLEHILVSGIIMAVALGIAAYVRFRYDIGHRVFRHLSAAWAISIGVVMVLSLTSDVTTTRCQSDPSQYCRYIDNIPFIATLVFFYVCTCLVRAFFLHFNR